MVQSHAHLSRLYHKIFITCILLYTASYQNLVKKSGMFYMKASNIFEKLYYSLLFIHICTIQDISNCKISGHKFLQFPKYEHSHFFSTFPVSVKNPPLWILTFFFLNFCSDAPFSKISHLTNLGGIESRNPHQKAYNCIKKLLTFLFIFQTSKMINSDPKIGCALQ